MTVNLHNSRLWTRDPTLFCLAVPASKSNLSTYFLSTLLTTCSIWSKCVCAIIGFAGHCATSLHHNTIKYASPLIAAIIFILYDIVIRTLLREVPFLKSALCVWAMGIACWGVGGQTLAWMIWESFMKSVASNKKVPQNGRLAGEGGQCHIEGANFKKGPPLNSFVAKGLFCQYA